MSAKKRSKKSHDAIFMALQVVLGVILGVLVGAGWLAFKPVKMLDAPPAKAEAKVDRHEVTYIRGRPPGRGAQGVRKQKAFLDRIPGQITFAEEDINGWLAGVFASKERTIRVEGIDLTMGPRVPLVRLVDDEMEIGLEIGMDRAGGSRTMVAQARGKFARLNGQQVFVPRQIYLGSCPLPWNLGGRALYEKLSALYPVADNVVASWSAVESAEIAKGRLTLTVAGGSAAPAPAVEVEKAPVSVPAPGTVQPPPAVEVTPAPAAETPTTPAPAAGEAAATPTGPLTRTDAVLEDVAEKAGTVDAVMEDAAAPAGSAPAP